MRPSRLYYESVGSGEPLVLIHAAIADTRMWDEQVEAFSARYRVIRYDAQGFGQSPAAVEPATRAEDLAELLRTLGISRAHLVGVSNGGSTAVDFAVLFPRMVGGLVPVAAGLSGYKASDPSLVEWLDQQDQRQEALLDLGDLDAATQIDLEVWLAGPPRRLQDTDAGLIDRLRPIARLALARRAERAPTPQIDPPAAERLDEVSAPTLVLVGECDVPLLLEISEVLAQRIPNATRYVFADTAHMVNMERPQEFNQRVLDFLAAHPLH
jgi:pimeloyl-ACP methyl ester carboxylesterase